MSDPYTQINLDEVEDAAPGNDLGSYWEARVARVALGAEQTGIAHFRLRPGKRSPFARIATRAPRRSTWCLAAADRSSSTLRVP